MLGIQLAVDLNQWRMKRRIYDAALDNFDYQIMVNREGIKDLRGESIVSQVSGRIADIIDNKCDLFFSTMY